jgi:hypothetical protein
MNGCYFAFVYYRERKICCYDCCAQQTGTWNWLFEALLVTYSTWLAN